ncbi:MAG TPA: class I SAM-dependent methyltransferase [Clostridia bacterium]|nr:class I SAM-dependent methyltransferase [Clostridia bacterium]
MDINNMLNFISLNMTKPDLFEPGEAKFWDDPHISKSMLTAHLDKDNDLASRGSKTIDRTIKYLLESSLLKPGMKVLDLGCGPGLYAEKLSKAGIHVVGIDISSRSLEYARQKAAETGLEIEYYCRNFFEMDCTDEFDAVIQVYGELNTFSKKKRDELLRLITKALKSNGVFIFDITTRELRAKYGVKSSWNVSDGGFWRPGKHLVLEQGFDYPEEDTWVDQYIVADDQEIKVYRNWFHDYSFDTIKPVLNNAGFKIKHVWNDLTGSNFSEGGDWIAICAEVMKD